MNRQKEILKQTAERHGLTTMQAEEIWNLFGNKIYSIISDPEKKTDGEYDIDKFPIIHIDNFGKFIPNKRKIRHANMCLKKKNESNT